MSASYLRSCLSVAALAAAVAFAPTASAHDQLTGSSPTPGAQLSSAPPAVTLTFNESVLKIGNQISVKGPDGSTKAATPTASGTKVSVPFTPSGNGAYQVTWRVTSSDGHPVSGQFSFTLKGQKAAGSSASSSGASTTAGQLGGLSAPPQSTAGVSPSTVKGPTTPTTDEKGDNQPALVIGGALVALAAVAAGFVVARKRVKGDPS